MSYFTFFGKGLGDTITDALAPVDTSGFTFDPGNALGVSSSAAAVAAGGAIGADAGSIFGQTISGSILSAGSVLTANSSGPTVTSGASPILSSLTSLIPGLATTAEKILTTQYSVPQTSAGQFYSTNSQTGVTTTYTLPSSTNATNALVNPFGNSITGFGSNPLLLLGLGAVVVFLFAKK